VQKIVSCLYPLFEDNLVTLIVQNGYCQADSVADLSFCFSCLVLFEILFCDALLYHNCLFIAASSLTLMLIFICCILSLRVRQEGCCLYGSDFAWHQGVEQRVLG
jgi:hypothetical protein